MPRHHHVNLAVPTGGLDDEGEFLVSVLGYRRIDPGPDLVARGANWFEGEDGGQVHLSVDPEHRPAARAHVAVEVGDDAAAIEARLAAAGTAFDVFDRDIHVLLCRDPAGNRWELRSPLT